jgi:hypothetical protein
MEPYFKLDFDIKIQEKDKHLVSLYKYSEKAIALITTEEFGKCFAKNFKDLNGKFNKNLTINEETVPGWIFRAQSDVAENLNALLKRIYDGDIKPVYTGIIKPDFNSNKKIFNLLGMLKKLIPEEKEQHVLSEDEQFKTTMYFNLEEDTDVITEGDIVYSLEAGSKKVEVYQLAK